MGLKKLLDMAELSRRGLLKGIGAIAAAVSVTGCSSDDDDDDAPIIHGNNLVFDKEAKEYWSSGAYNCGARCVHKIFAKNGRLLKMTSAGDIPREGCQQYDEEIGENGSIQRRACVRGYAYIQRLYQPDRLKYPLKQTKTKGDLTGFVRISWQEAYELAAKAIYDAYKRKEELGYVPILDRWRAMTGSFAPYLSPSMMTVGNESTGAADAAKYDSVGADGLCNNMADRFNSDFILTWGLDPTRTTYHVAHAHWYNTKCKERGIPIVVITSNYNDTAAMISTGFTHTYKVNGQEKTVTVPGWVPCRPATDGALAVGMAYVMHKNAIYDDTFVRNYCFGYHKGDTHVSTSGGIDLTGTGQKVSTLTFGHSKNLKTPHDFVDDAGKQFKKGDPYTGATFTVPEGKSFEEYLLSREVEWGGAVAAAPIASDPNDPYPPFIQPATEAVPGDATYQAVLAYIAKITGVPADTIEALAFKYAKPLGDNGGVSFIDAGGGPQRAMNGVEWQWLAICLTAMTGHIAKSGGGPAYSMMSHTDIQALGLYDAGGISFMPPSGMLADAYNLGDIHIIMSNWSHLIHTGKDMRSRERLIEDIRLMVGDELADKLAALPRDRKLLEVDLWWVSSGNFMTTTENVSKAVEAVKSVKTVIVVDLTMTPTATHADIIFPASSHYEQEGTQTQVSSAAIHYTEKVIDTLFDTKPDAEIMAGIKAAFNKMAGTNLSTEWAPSSAASIAAFGPSQMYINNVGGENRRMSLENLKAKGFDEFVIPPSKPLVPFGTDPVKNAPNCILGYLENTTGKINFYSPLWGKIRPKDKDNNGFRVATASYVENPEGYEKFFDDAGKFVGVTSPNSGRTYKLYYMTNKARQRAHTVFDNVAMIRDNFPQTVKMNIKDAAERGIKNGDTVYVYNDRGCTKILAETGEEMPPGVISVEHGAWYRASTTETVKVWMNIGSTDCDDVNPAWVEMTVPIDVGGTENMITYELAGKECMVGQAVSAQGGACEVSLTKPE